MSEPDQNPTSTPTLPIPAPERPRLMPKLTHEERMAKNRRAIESLNRFMTEGDPEEQCETWEILRKALGPERTISNRSLFP
jgi:hypothetical protein